MLNKDKLNDKKLPFPAILDEHPEALIICDSQSGEILFLNKKCKELCISKDLSGCKGKNFLELESFGEESNWEYLKQKLSGGVELKIENFNKSDQPAYFYFNSRISKEFSQELLLISVIDITRWKTTEIDLSTKEEKYRNFAEFLPAMVCETDSQGRITFANRNAFLKFGYTLDDLQKGVNVIDLIAPLDRKKAYHIFKARNIFKNIPPQEYLAITTKGRTFPVIVHMGIVKKGKEIVGFRGVMFDITERKKIENKVYTNFQQQELISKIAVKLSNPENFNQKIIKAIEQIVESLNLDTILIKIIVDKSIHTFSNKSVKGRRFYRKKLSEKTSVTIKNMEEILSTQQEEVDVEIKKLLEVKDFSILAIFPIKVLGETVGIFSLLDTRGSEVRDQEIKVYRMLSILISHEFERKIVEQKLYEKDLTNRAILNSFPDVLLLVNEKNDIVDSNNYEDLFKKKKPKSVIGKRINEIFNRDVSIKLESAIDRCLVTSKHLTEFSFQGSTFETRLIKISDNLIQILMRNISRQKQHQKELEEAKIKAEQASNSKSEFLANMSHEIRTPLNAILGFSEGLLNKPEVMRFRSQLSAIYSAGRTLLSLINDILDLSKIEAGKMEILTEPVSLKQLFREINQIFEQKIFEKNLSFIIEINDDFPSYLLLDEVRIRQILFNLVGNSIKFTEVGHIKVKANFSKYPDKESGDLIIEVEDTGIGIPRNQQKLIFEAFRQQSGQSSRKYGGTGLGLAITKKLVKKMKGFITLESRIWHGTSFKVVLPDVEQKEKSYAGHKYYSDSSNVVFENSTILVIDDIEYNIEVLRNMCSDSKNLEILSAHNGKQVKNILNKTIPDMILLDLRMPGEDGFSVARKIKLKKEWKNIPIIAFTASAFSLKDIKSKRLFTGTIPKPLNKKQVLDEFKKYLPHTQINISGNNSYDYLKMDLVQDQIQNLPEVFTSLSKLYEQKWRIIKNDLVIFEIENFSKEIGKLGEQYNFEQLIQYDAQLTEALQSFDIELIERRINDFPNILEKIKNIVNNANE